jgi:hypothetical protein
VQELADEWQQAATGRRRYTHVARAMGVHEAQWCHNTSHPSCPYRADVPWHPATVLVANCGLWDLNGTSIPGTLERVESSLRQSPHFRAIWKSTTPQLQPELFNYSMDVHKREVAVFPPSTKWQFMDVYDMLNQAGPRQSHADSNHFLPFIYEQLNIYLLNRLCVRQWDFVAHTE